MEACVDKYSMEFVANVRHMPQLNRKQGLGSLGSGGGSTGSSFGGKMGFPGPPGGPLGPKFIRN